MKELRELMRYPPFVYQAAEKWSMSPEELAEHSYTTVIDYGYFCEWESEDHKLKEKMADKRGKMKGKLQDKLRKR